MKQYQEICKKALAGTKKSNRTGVDHIGYHGDMMKFDLREGFPLVTTKQMAWKSCFAEMFGFLRGYDNASQFRALGCNVWNANSNENKQWLANPHRLGTDDLGRIYGVQGRRWLAMTDPKTYGFGATIDQLKNVVSDLSQRKDNRREIITYWNPGELNTMALPPCCLLYQLSIEGDYLNLSMYQRSCDVPLGVPFNIAGYAWLLSVIAQITDLKPGIFTHFMHDIHIYENQVAMMKEQVRRIPYELPTLFIEPRIKTLQDLETWVTPDCFQVINYKHHPAIPYPFSV